MKKMIAPALPCSLAIRLRALLLVLPVFVFALWFGPCSAVRSAPRSPSHLPVHNQRVGVLSPVEADRRENLAGRRDAALEHKRPESAAAVRSP
ncbi:hypothetical protein [Gloeobacter kilaueensis]|uniref:Uncharacterized protein n=1 Tax=Gloeobacter kilaueensis (strain ATCC BAA-2537 / CCAP 1431/1 / ULC 316 / JS1) TaxID=1183438 RepID=U5QIS6_GLOK1|nr:hypothetical protein [Gloeobacter kilaueensis]AGY57585.1 hypothetical protein GKIL_1339 [Gloeobacter kilaueensis JS1]